jgi:hypothetical protein
MRRFALGLALALGVLAGGASADEEAQLAAWQERLEAAESELTRARERVAAALVAYDHMRHDRSARGEEKSKVIAEREQAQDALANARASLDALREEARRAGVPPAWILPDPGEEPPPADL